MRVPYAAPSYGQAEIDAVVRVLSNPGQIVAGHAVQEFERRIATLFGKLHGVMVNSGSSANLLALASLDLPPGSEVITPALTFATTVAPIVQLSLVPVFVDVGEDTYVVDVGQVEAAVTDRTRALMVPSLLGLQPDWIALRALADERGLALIADSCDTLGPFTDHADVTTTSFYASHVITAAGGGGMACFREEGHARKARLLANWGRASTLFGHGSGSEDIDRRFAEGYDAKFLFTEMGYNMQPLELQAAFGLVQLEGLAERAAERTDNWLLIEGALLPMAHIVVPRVAKWGEIFCPLAFPFRVLPDAPFFRNDLARHLEAAGIQTRPIMTGNITWQPGFRRLGTQDFPNADAAMAGGILVGCHQELGLEDMHYIANTVHAFVEAHS